MVEFNVSVGDSDATFSVEDFSPGTPQTQWEPGEGASCSLAPMVLLTDDNGVDTEVDLETAVKLYGVYRDVKSYDDALSELEDLGVEAYADLMEAMGDRDSY